MCWMYTWGFFKSSSPAQVAGVSLCPAQPFSFPSLIAFVGIYSLQLDESIFPNGGPT